LCLNHQKTKTIQKKLLSDKQIKFKELCVSWNKFHKNLPRDSFKIFVWKNVVLYEIYSKESKVTNTEVLKVSKSSWNTDKQWLILQQEISHYHWQKQRKALYWTEQNRTECLLIWNPYTKDCYQNNTWNTKQRNC
jgi:hypothetical protein